MAAIKKRQVNIENVSLKQKDNERTHSLQQIENTVRSIARLILIDLV